MGTAAATILGVLKVSVLARLLDPSDFGIMAIINVVIGFTRLFADLGVSTALLHKQNVRDNDYASLFWLNIFVSLLLLVILIGSVSLISNVYSEGQLTELIPLTGLNLLFVALGGVFRTREQKKLNFKFITLVDLAVAVVGIVVAVVMAMNGYGVYSLIFSTLISTLIGAFAFILKSRKLIRFRFRMSEMKPYLSIGGYSAVSQVINYFNKEMDVILIGSFYGKEILGGYSLAKQFVDRPASFFRPVILKVMSPILSSIQNETSDLKAEYSSLLRLTSTIALLVLVGVELFSELLITVFLGESYLWTTDLFRILGVYYFFITLRIPIGALVVATGRTKLELLWFGFTLLITPVFIYLGSLMGIEGVAFGLLLSMMLLFIPMWRLFVNKLIAISLPEYLKAHIPSFSNLYLLIKMKGE